MSNAIKAENGIEVYEHDIKYYACLLYTSDAADEL